MQAATKRWILALIASVAAHAAVACALVVALPASPLRGAAESVKGLGARPALRVNLVGTSPSPQPLRVEIPSDSVPRSWPQPRRQARTPTVKVAASEAMEVNDLAKSNSPLGETGAQPFTGGGESTGLGSAVAGFQPEQNATGLPSEGSGALDRLAELHQRLADSAQRCYPNAARRLRLQGEVALHFCLSEQGRASAATLRGSTGSALLDRAARECVLAGALPARGMLGCYDLPIKFSGGQ